MRTSIAAKELLTGLGRGPTELLRDFPDMARGIGEGRGAAAPRPVDRTVEEHYAKTAQRRANGVHVIDLDREQNARA